MDALKKAVLAANADLGVITDTDPNRAAFVFADGEEVNKDGVIALMAAALSTRKTPPYNGGTDGFRNTSDL